MKFLIVGLGNPGPEYKDTRHNIGFQVLDALTGASNLVFGPARYADHAELRHKGRTFILVKPSTFMNLSGKAVRYWMDQENVPADRTLVITDDLALPFGAIRRSKPRLVSNDLNDSRIPLESMTMSSRSAAETATPATARRVRARCPLSDATTSRPIITAA